ncbi:Nucleoporin, Nup85-like protein [Anaeromyces robustus]|uniref:Nuclear pore complex protein Nup85 n=1 Tax=Anaeromyces robustus TaxID=1754192 RepID=A0A1Y1VRD2_9FUNG|nr:Nucleoporin, Nup85-like protein [Anaeromyces robustus]|eukprot:ORX63304.1 Nucleoporin, Nup85-like protein [Anaeromyces robustus]
MNTYNLDFAVNNQQLSDNNQILLGRLNPSNQSGIFTIGARDPSDDNNVTKIKNKLSNCTWKQIPESRRSFIANTFEIFMDLHSNQALSENDITNDKINILNKYSKEYREKIEIEKQNNSIDENEKNMFNEMYAIFHLYEVLYLSENVNNNISELLARWLTDNFYTLSIDEEKLLKSDKPLNEKEDWDLLLKCILNINKYKIKAVTLFQKYCLNNSLFNKNSVFEKLIEVINAMPNVIDYQKYDEYKKTWIRWQSKVKIIFKESNFMVPNNASFNFDIENYCHRIFGILAGDIESIINSCDSWKQIIVSIIYFNQPEIKVTDIKTLFSHCGSNTSYTLLDSILSSLFKEDLNKCITLCTKYDFWWLPTHLADMMSYHYKFEGLKDYDCDLASWIKINYADSLGLQNDNWEIALGYVSTCPDNIKESLKTELINHIPLNSDMKVKKLIANCKKYNLKNVITDIHKTLGMKEYSKGNYGEAIKHYMEINDAYRISLICNELISQYIEKGDLSQLNFIDTINQKSLYNTKINFLARYKQFHELYKDGQYNKAGSLLIQLLTSEIAPKTFWSIILIDAIPLLESEQIIFNSSDTYELMRCLEEITTSHRRNEYLAALNKKVKSEQELENLVDVIRMALVRNLARTSALLI